MSSARHTVTDDQIFAIENIQPFQIALASVSIVCSGSIIYILIQYYNDLVRGKPFIHLLLMMAISDTMSSLALSFGFPKDNALCSIQGFLYIFFERLSWFWLDALVVILDYFAMYHKVLLSIKQIHYIIWPLSIVLQILPFTTSTGYGSPVDDLIDDDIQIGICVYSVYHGSLDSYFVWTIMAFTVELLLSFLLVLGLTIRILCLGRQPENGNVMTLLPVVSTVRETLILYPLAQLITTIPGIIYDIYHVFYFQTHGNFLKHYVSRQDLLVAITPLNSILFTIIFYAKTGEALIKWKEIYGICKNKLFRVFINDDNDNIYRDSSIEV